MEETAEGKKMMVLRFCVHCFHEWKEEVNREQLRKIVEKEAIGNCPNPTCGLPT